MKISTAPWALWLGKDYVFYMSLVLPSLC